MILLVPEYSEFLYHGCPMEHFGASLPGTGVKTTRAQNPDNEAGRCLAFSFYKNYKTNKPAGEFLS
jgi:hypothetical protein